VQLEQAEGQVREKEALLEDARLENGRIKDELERTKKELGIEKARGKELEVLLEERAQQLKDSVS
jgi:hypothetical protein